MMPKDEWGVKRLCPTTGRRFYDLNKDPIVSPYTGEVIDLATNSPSPAKAVTKAKEKAANDDILDDETDTLEDGDDISIDDELLDDDDDDDNVNIDELADVPAEEDES